MLSAFREPDGILLYRRMKLNMDLSARGAARHPSFFTPFAYGPTGREYEISPFPVNFPTRVW